MTVFAALSPASAASANSATNSRTSSTETSPSERDPTPGAGASGRRSRSPSRYPTLDKHVAAQGTDPSTQRTFACCDKPRLARPARSVASERLALRARWRNALGGLGAVAAPRRRTASGASKHQKSRCAGLSQCAREDSNLHGPYSPQGPQPCASTNSATGAGGGQYNPGSVLAEHVGSVDGAAITAARSSQQRVLLAPALSPSWRRAKVPNTRSTESRLASPNEQGAD